VARQRRTLVVGLLVACVALARGAETGAQAQNGSPPQGRNPQGPPRGGGAGGGRNTRGQPPVNPDVMNAQEVDRLFDGHVVLEARTRLQLTDDQFFRFVPRVERLQQLRRRLEGERRRILGELSDRAGAPGPMDEPGITALLRALDDLRVQSADLLRQSYADLDVVLNPRQRARFRAFENMMEQRKLELVALARQRAREAAGPRATQPPPAPARGGGG
jgi:hypothetical protein